MSKELKPQIRFKGFEDEWDRATLKDFGKCQSGVGFPEKEQGGEIGIPFFKVSDMNNKGNEFVMQNSNNYVTNEQISKNCWKIISTLPSIIFAKVGAAVLLNRKRLVTKPFMIDNNMMAYKIQTNVDSLYLTYLFHTLDLPSLSQVGALPSINASDIENLLIIISFHNDEQKIIGTYFSNIENLISETEREIVRLEKMKQASLQKMFPRAGSTTPEIRFAGFTEPWKIGKLSDILEIDNTHNSNNKYGREDVLSVSGDYGLVNQIEFQGRSFAGASLIGYKITKPGQVIYTKSPLKAQPFGIIKSNQYGVGIISPLYAVYNPKEDKVADFVHYYFAPVTKLNNYLRPLINKGAKNTILISDETALDGEIVYPEGKEQRLIADYFLKLDKLLLSKRQKLEKLHQIKQACLDKMFVNVTES